MKKNDEFNSFNIRSYSKAELGLLYAPFATPKSASRKLVKWIQGNAVLLRALRDLGLTDTAKVFTPAQVRLIVEVLGEP